MFEVDQESGCTFGLYVGAQLGGHKMLRLLLHSRLLFPKPHVPAHLPYSSVCGCAVSAKC